MKKYILALDEGTTSARAILFDRAGKAVASGQREFPQYYPHSGWVEHNANEIIAAQLSAIDEAMENAAALPGEIASVGITNQRETVVVWDRRTGKPLCPAIVWQCRRTSAMCEKLAADGYAPMIAEKTGLRPDAYFSGSKIAWILENVPGVRELAEQGDALAGTIDTWLLWKLSGGKVFRTDETNASRTMLYNLRTRTWDDELLALFDIPRRMLPEILPSGAPFGSVQIGTASVPVCGIAGDQQAALFGQRCFRPGDAKNTYGTGCFLLVNCGTEIPRSKSGLLTTAAAVLTGEPAQYALEGSVFIGGAVIQWLRDGLGLISSAPACDALAETVPDTGGVIIVHAFTGLGAPYWNMHARGAITGLTRATTAAHLARAALEAIAFQSEDLLQAAREDSGVKLTSLRVDGGATHSRPLMQMQADFSDTNILRPHDAEATARGAAFLAGLTCGFWRSREELPADGDPDVFKPAISPEARAARLAEWHEAVGSLMKQ